MSRLRYLAIGVLLLIVLVAPFLPNGHHAPEGAFVPSGRDQRPDAPIVTAPGRVTPQMAREIDRVVQAGRRPVSPRAGLAALATAGIRCADFEGQRYCLGVGWTTQSQEQLRARFATAARAARHHRESTGDLDPTAFLTRNARLSPSQRATADRAELTAAARSVAKVWLLRHQIQGVALPHGFWAAHPEARPRTSQAEQAADTPTLSSKQVKPASSYPESGKVLSPKDVAEQTMSYWCGPTSTQMIVWGWTGEEQSQSYWASKLGTTSSGTSITSIVSVINRYTGWDQESYAGPYIVLDISDWSYAEWKLLLMRHIVDYRAPIVLHPILLKAYFPYLDDDASGHYQVGRGYSKNGPDPFLIGFFEPWNQQRFDPSEPYIARVQWRPAYQSYRANQAHYLHNLGV